jgi:hypothetical protein
VVVPARHFSQSSSTFGQPLSDGVLGLHVAQLLPAQHALDTRVAGCRLSEAVHVQTLGTRSRGVLWAAGGAPAHSHQRPCGAGRGRGRGVRHRPPSAPVQRPQLTSLRCVVCMYCMSIRSRHGRQSARRGERPAVPAAEPRVPRVTLIYATSGVLMDPGSVLAARRRRELPGVGREARRWGARALTRTETHPRWLLLSPRTGSCIPVRRAPPASLSTIDTLPPAGCIRPSSGPAPWR